MQEFLRLSSIILKASTPYVSSPYMFNKILSTGTFPNRLKFLEVKPLYKEGDKTEFSKFIHHFLKLLKKLFIEDYIVT